VSHFAGGVHAGFAGVSVSAALGWEGLQAPRCPRSVDEDCEIVVLDAVALVREWYEARKVTGTSKISNGLTVIPRVAGLMSQTCHWEF
jgi:hypothetical protein